VKKWNIFGTDYCLARNRETCATSTDFWDTDYYFNDEVFDDADEFPFY